METVKATWTDQAFPRYLHPLVPALAYQSDAQQIANALAGKRSQRDDFSNRRLPTIQADRDPNTYQVGCPDPSYASLRRGRDDPVTGTGI